MMTLRRLAVWMLIAAMIAGPVPVALALGCIPQAPSAASPCDEGGCEDPDEPALSCTCIHYPAPHGPGALAVLALAPALSTSAPMAPTLPAPPASVPARDDPPEPPPPRASRPSV